MSSIPSNSIAPDPVKVSNSTLYIGIITAFVVAILASCLGISYLICGTSTAHHDSLVGVCKDDHYKYLVPLLIPTTVWFVIANWVGWEFFRNA